MEDERMGESDFIVRRFNKKTYWFDFYSDGKWTADITIATGMPASRATQFSELLDVQSTAYLHSLMFSRTHTFGDTVDVLQTL